jgi:hypothetical protein
MPAGFAAASMAPITVTLFDPSGVGVLGFPQPVVSLRSTTG